VKDELATRRNALPSARLSVRMYDQMLRPHRQLIIDMLAATKHLLLLERRRPVPPLDVLDGFCAALEIDIDIVDARRGELFSEEATSD